eukprot:TRINITY_DN13851_c0_g1_i4.p1 TRINITY_DN13851_c0_g1~~TRINITY_DN13851_c0_g1_i4.p1  ORF type:complete len:204 (+),score=47.83 TRINITY_DN13851_c0_g1_i4:125-736(+)
MIRRPPRSTLSSSSAASDVYKRQLQDGVREFVRNLCPQGCTSRSTAEPSAELLCMLASTIKGSPSLCEAYQKLRKIPEARDRKMFFANALLTESRRWQTKEGGKPVCQPERCQKRARSSSMTDDHLPGVVVSGNSTMDRGHDIQRESPAGARVQTDTESEEDWSCVTLQMKYECALQEIFHLKSRVAELEEAIACISRCENTD